MDMQTALEPIVKTLDLRAPVDKAFHHFTENIHLWWPMARHSLSQADAVHVVFEGEAGGRLYEVDKDGREREWGRVLEWDAPRRAVFSWVLEAPEKRTEVEIQFAEGADGGSVLTLIHRGWENRPDGAEWRKNYHTGWDGVLGNFVDSLESSLSP